MSLSQTSVISKNRSYTLRATSLQRKAIRHGGRNHAKRMGQNKRIVRHLAARKMVNRKVTSRTASKSVSVNSMAKPACAKKGCTNGACRR